MSRWERWRQKRKIQVRGPRGQMRTVIDSMSVRINPCASAGRKEQVRGRMQLRGMQEVQGCKSEGLFSSADAEMRGEVTGQLTRSKA